jgi:hypothetical protein
MKVGRFFVEGGGDGGTIDVRGEVHEVDILGEGAHSPSKMTMKKTIKTTMKTTRKIPRKMTTKIQGRREEQ